jgi:Flp pilus assembly protein TadG
MTLPGPLTWLRDARGVAAVEFACVAPLFALALVGMTELGLAVRTRLAAEEAAAAGAQAALKGFNATTIAAAVQSANPTRTVTATPAPTEFYACPSASGLTASTQNATCSDGKASRHFVHVYARISRPTVFGAQFGMPTSYTAQATARTP